jgi:hypothetical protein
MELGIHLVKAVYLASLGGNSVAMDLGAESRFYAG